MTMTTFVCLDCKQDFNFDYKTGFKPLRCAPCRAAFKAESARCRSRESYARMAAGRPARRVRKVKSSCTSGLKNLLAMSAAERSTRSQFFKILFDRCHLRALERELPITISPEAIETLWLQQEGLCAVTGYPMTHLRGQGSVPTNASIDRLDSAGGYTIENIRLVCARVNIMRHTMTDTELLAWCRAVASGLTTVGAQNEETGISR